MTPEALSGHDATTADDSTVAPSEALPPGVPLVDPLSTQALPVPLDLGSALDGDDPAPTTVPYDPARARESVRGIIALSLIALLAAVVIASFVLLWIHPDRMSGLHDLLGLVFAPLIALVGAATGYYFGSHQGR